MRGFAMLMVVWGHVSIDGNTLGLETIMWKFAMPLFFFISGFVTWREGKVWNFSGLATFLKRKVSVLLLFPFICMCACSIITKKLGIVDALWHQQKLGYWFVFTLLQLNIVYIVLQIVLQRIKGKYTADLILFAIAVVTFMASHVLHKYMGLCGEALVEGSRSTAGLLSWMQFANNFQWFVCGAIARKHYAAYTKWLSNDVLLIVCILALIALAQLAKGNCFTAALESYCSTTLVLSFFHKHQRSFTAERKFGRLMQYIGRRTLDIYLLHYFFWYTSDFKVFAAYYPHTPILKFVVTMSFAIIVTALSLLVGNVLRQSRFIARWGFGEK